MCRSIQAEPMTTGSIDAHFWDSDLPSVRGPRGATAISIGARAPHGPFKISGEVHAGGLSGVGRPMRPGARAMHRQGLGATGQSHLGLISTYIYARFDFPAAPSVRSKELDRQPFILGPATPKRRLLCDSCCVRIFRASGAPQTTEIDRFEGNCAWRAPDRSWCVC